MVSSTRGTGILWYVQLVHNHNSSFRPTCDVHQYFILTYFFHKRVKCCLVFQYLQELLHNHRGLLRLACTSSGFPMFLSNNRVRSNHDMGFLSRTSSMSFSPISLAEYALEATLFTDSCKCSSSMSRQMENTYTEHKQYSSLNEKIYLCVSPVVP